MAQVFGSVPGSWELLATCVGRSSVRAHAVHGSLGRRAAAAAVPFVLFVAAALFAWRALGPPPAIDRPANRAPGVLPAANPFADLTEGWTELPAPPEVRIGAASAWTGAQLLIWGGHSESKEGNVNADGLVFDAASRTWDTMPAAPLEPRTHATSAWTDSELLVWGGWQGAYGYEFAEGFGAGYDPATKSWRSLPPAPITPRAPLSVWTGRELIVWGTSLRVQDRPRDGAAYDPSTNTWRTIPDAPIELTDATAAWTGDEMIVFGAALHGGNVPETPTAIGAAYDPQANSWRRIADFDLDPNANTAVWTGGELVAWDYNDASAAYDPTTDHWRELPELSLDQGEDVPEGAYAAGIVLTEYFGQLSVFDPAADRWSEIENLPFRGGYLQIVGAGDVFLIFFARPFGERDELWAWRPAPTTLGSVASGVQSPHVGATLDLEGCPTALAAGEGAAWVSLGCQREGGELGPGELVRIDPVTDQRQHVLVGAPVVTLAAGSVWAAGHGNDNAVTRIDPHTLAVQATIDFPEGIADLTGGHDGVWVLTYGNSVYRIDPATNAVVATVSLEGATPSGSSSKRVAIDFEEGEGALWILDLGVGEQGEISDGFVLRVDSETSRITDVIPVGYSLDLAVGAGAVWTNREGTGAVRIDARTLDVEPMQVRNFEPFAVGEGGVWFLDRGATDVAVSRLDPETLEIDVSIPVPSFPSTVGLEPALDTTSHTVWVPSDDRDQITRIDLY